MVLRALGASMMARLIQTDRDLGLDSLWLLFGPTDLDVVEGEDKSPPFMMAAE